MIQRARAPRAAPPGSGGAPGGWGTLAVVADDLTGAADAAAPFAARGAEVSIVLRWPPPDGLEVLALVTDGRWRDPAAAGARVGQAVTAARAWGADRLFVKVDSTLRGNVLAEVTAALSAWGDATAVATPAFPAQGRVVRNGGLLVYGEPHTAQVAALFPDGVEVSDALDDMDLLALGRRVVRDGKVAVGSAGLARALAEVLAPAAPPLRRPSVPVTGVLVVVGTTHPASRAQSAVLRSAGVVCLVLGPPAPTAIDPLAVELARGGRVLVTTDVAADVEGDSPRAQAMAATLAGVARELLLAAPGSALVVTGGSTALAVADVLGAGSLRLLGEVAAGVALGELRVGDRPIPTITKSGGFGAPEALLRAVEHLEECA